MTEVTVRVYGSLNNFLRSAINAALLPRTRQHYDQFEACGGCGRIYWKGAHWERLMHAIDGAREEAERRAWASPPQITAL